MERQANADVPDMLVYYNRYELGIAEAGKEELDSTKELNDTSLLLRRRNSFIFLYIQSSF